MENANNLWTLAVEWVLTMIPKVIAAVVALTAPVRAVLVQPS
jgi:hypothetical protein